MCGIAGIASKRHSISKEMLLQCVHSMVGTLGHRGPDDAGVWGDSECGVALGHTRLAVLDLSENAAQPMVSLSNRYVLSYNGEVYNAPALRECLLGKGTAFRGHSDTEVVLGAIEQWGVEETLNEIKGMFAFAVWDRKEQMLFIARDPIGKKPLYYGVIDGQFVFSSELKAIHHVFKQELEIDRKALALFTQFGFVPGSYSIYQNIYKLEAGTFLQISLRDGDGIREQACPERAVAYWSACDLGTVDGADSVGSSYDERLEQLHDVLKNAVRTRMVSDVPIGAFLSGGIDSSLVTAIMQEASEASVKTFCIGFEDKKFDESGHALKIADYLGTEHTTLYTNEREAFDIIPRLAEVYDEPFADYSQIPTYLICKHVRKETTVALSGDGGDEAFCGYSRYFMGKRLLDQSRFIPKPIKVLLKQVLLSCSQKHLSSGAAVMSRVFFFMKKYNIDGKRIHSIARFLCASTPQEMALAAMSLSSDVGELMQGGGVDFEGDFNFEGVDEWSALEQMMMIDTCLYLPDDVLVKVDRASMANSLEVRSPLLDKDVIEFAWQLPVEDKIYPDQMRGKRMLHDVLERYVPRHLTERPKQGFSVPMASWLRGPLKEWGGDLLSEAMLKQTGLYDPFAVRKLWDDFQSEKRDHHQVIWAILMAQAWHVRWFGL